MFCVYIHSTPDAKHYIGISQDINNSWAHGYGYRSNKRFFEAIERFGWNKLQHTIMGDTLPLEEAQALAAKLIKKYDTTNPIKGFNLATSAEYCNPTAPQAYRPNINAKTVLQLDMQDNVITSYDSISSAARAINGTQVSLSACLNGRLKTYKGSKWRFKNA